MKILTGIGEMKGKTIVKAEFIYHDLSLGIFFDDNTCIFFEPFKSNDDDSLFLNVMIDIDDMVQVNHGIITREQYEERLKQIQQAHEEQIRTKELKILAELKNKYE